MWNVPLLVVLKAQKGRTTLNRVALFMDF